MAAAVVGHAARRLGGGALRQTQEAAVSRLSSAVGRRLSPRFAHTEVHERCTCGKPEKTAVMNRIQKKKEELFDDMTEAYNKYGVDRALLRDLSDHVERRSGDPAWEWAQKAKLKHDLLKVSGSVTLIAGGTYLYGKTLSCVFDWLN